VLQANLVTAYLQMLTSGGAPQRTDIRSPAQVFPQFSPGVALSALIVSQLGPGLYLADIDGQRVQLNVPVPVTPGEQVSLRMLRTTPVPVFDLIRAEPTPQRTQASFSGAAQLIGSVLAEGTTPERPPAATALVQAPADAEELANALRVAVANSGVFYESHLRAWVAGKRALAELQREPQAGWRVEQDAAATPDETQGRLRGSAIPDEARPVLRQQLDALEMNRAVWSGLVWPDQYATVTIAEDAPRSGAPPAEIVWRTSVKLQLPRLGDLHADLILRESDLSVSIGCGDHHSAERMGTDLPQLRARLEAEGFVHNDLRVSHHAAR